MSSSALTGSLLMRAIILRTCFGNKNAQRGRHCPDRSPEIQRPVYENPVPGRIDGRARRDLCYRHPISNSMVELYTIQRYLQYRMLQEMGLVHFDDWASNFGETVTAIELSPEGTGYRAKTRFAKFYNLPELMAAFKGGRAARRRRVLGLPYQRPTSTRKSLNRPRFRKR